MDISLQQVGYLYGKDTPFEKRALQGVDATIRSGSYSAIIGHTGSGKSTLLMHLNGLLKPSEGVVQIGDTIISAGTKAKGLKDVRRHVGIVFQFPEHQLFEETVEKDIMFGPMNFGVPEEEARRRAHELIALLGCHQKWRRSRHSIYRVDRCVVLRLRVCWHLNRPYWCWMSQLLDLIQEGDRRLWSCSIACTWKSN